MSQAVPPQSLEAEVSVLGALMLDQDAWDEVADVLAEEDFYKPAHRKIFSTIRDLHRKGEPCDLITISTRLNDQKELESIGGASYLAEILDQTIGTANVTSHAKIVHENSLLRKVINTSQTIINSAYEKDFEDVGSFLDRVESEIFKVAEQKSDSGLTDASELVKSSILKLEELYAQKLTVTGVPSGFTELDDMTAGFQRGDLIICAARPSMGKTAFSLNVVLHAALKENKKVAFFSVEMGKESLMIRLLANAAKVRMSDLRVGQISEKDWPKLINTAAKMSETGLFIDDTSGISPFEIRSKARRLKAKHGLDLIVIDYLQLMGMKQRMESREREVSEISKLLKAIAKELEVPVIALAQLNRASEGRSDRRPMLSDLRESGSIEQDADVIMMLFREDYYDKDNPEIKGMAEVIVAKQRNGPTDTVKLRWFPEFGIFENNVENKMGPAPPPPDMPPPGTPPRGGNRQSGPPKNFAPGS